MNQEWTAVVCPDGKIQALRTALMEDAERLVSALGKGQHEQLDTLARQLLATAQRQFQAEEQRLRGAGAPSLERHSMEHERFLADLGAMLSLATRGDTRGVVALKPDRWIPDWLAAHACTDRDLVA
jgi:hemerythrin